LGVIRRIPQDSAQNLLKNWSKNDAKMGANSCFSWFQRFIRAVKAIFACILARIHQKLLKNDQKRIVFEHSTEKNFGVRAGRKNSTERPQYTY
jgi:GT2 family glycosyltransferase